MNKKAVLFDMDGTLINTYENINYRLALSELKSVQKTLLLKVMSSRPRSYADMERRIREECDDPELADHLVQRVTSFLQKHYQDAELKNGALDFLKYLREKKYRICLCTNNATEIVEYILQDKGLDGFFDYVITSQQVTEAKPHPQMYVEAMKQIQVEPHECIIFEDTDNGIEAAQRANVDVVLVSEKEKRKKTGYCMIISDFSDQRLYEYF